MATTQPIPAMVDESESNVAPAISPATPRETQALVPAPNASEDNSIEEAAVSAPVAKLPVELDVAIPVREFRIRNLLALVPGQLIESQWGHTRDVPLATGDVQLAWSEFEVVDTRLAVRMTRLAGDTSEE
jgi:flagellar motor switch protein FliM